MAKRWDPQVLRLVVKVLRSWTRMSQAQFGEACRVAQPVLSIYESGKRAPSEAVLRRMAKVAKLDWSLMLQLCKFFSSFVAAARSGSSSDAKALDISLLEPVLLAVIPYLEAHASEPAPPSPEDELREAERIWAALEKHPIAFRRRLIEISPRAGSWALAVKASEASVQRANHSAEEALELAELALSIAGRIPGEEVWRSRVEGYGWAHVANARRVANDLAGAETAFARAWECWRSGADPAPVRLAEWRLYDLEASLRRAQRSFPDSLRLLDEARSRCGSDPLAAGRILLKKEHVFDQMGETQKAISALQEAAPFVEAAGDARLLFSLRFNMADNLCHLERYSEAAGLLPKVRDLAGQQGNDLDLLRLVWLESKVAAGQGRSEKAIAGLEQVGRAFTSREMPYDAALSSLDLAVLLLKAGRAAEVKELAVAMGWIFNANGIAREALAALKLFCDAARQERATVELARKVMAEIEQAGRSAT